MPDEARLSPHPHECPVTGCHLQYDCVEASCIGHYYKNCANHQVSDAPAAQPKKPKRPKAKKPRPDT